MGYNLSHGCAYYDFRSHSVISIEERLYEKAKNLLDFVMSFVKEFVFDHFVFVFVNCLRL